MLNTAKKLAEKYHKNQKYGDEPYINHLTRVQKAVKNAGYNEKYQVVAILHDIAEDTGLNCAYIEKAFGREIAGAVASITHDVGKNYRVYLEEDAMKNEVSKVVKFFDVIDNLEHSIVFFIEDFMIT